jgi:hypothetical protein
MKTISARGGKARKARLHRNSLGLLASALVLLTGSHHALACATCGCALSSDGAIGYGTGGGFHVSLQYDYLDQDQLRHGGNSASRSQAATIPDQEVENKTTTRFTTLGLSYTPDANWNYRLLVPYIDRSHSTYGENPALPLTPDQLSHSSSSSLGDIKAIVSYQGLLPTHNLGVQLGVKLPTGDYGGSNAAGTGAVGRNPVYFGAAGNAGGEVLDSSLQPGSGSTDLIVGAYYFQAVSQNFDAFVNGQYQAAVMHALDHAGADFRPGDVTTVSVGLRYEAQPTITPQLQLNITHRAADRGALADTANTEGTVAYLSPGVSANLGSRFNVYAFAQLPVYSHLQGYQLFPHWIATVGVDYGF